MDDLRTLLFDPDAASRLVLARRPVSRSPGRAVVADVVSDVVWTDVVRLLRWATAAPDAPLALRTGAWWRLAVGCSDLLRRLPSLGDELAERWSGAAAGAPVDDDAPAGERARRATGRLATALLAPAPPDLRALAVLVDALGAAAVAVLAEQSWERLTGSPA
jgi:hypothetical protein